MEQQASQESPSALAHLRVVELGDMPAAYCAGLFGSLGADVIKVEPPGGDPNRWLPPFAGDLEDPERSLPFINANTDKRSIVLDLLNSPADRTTMGHLLATADVLVDAMPPGHLEALGFGQERLQEVSPGLVTVSLTPFGQTGPHSGYKGNEAIAQAMSGLMYIQGDNQRPPCVAPCQPAYQIAAYLGAFLALAALRHRRETGVGQRIDLSLQEAISYATLNTISRYSRQSEITRRPGAQPVRAGSNTHRCSDGRYVNFAPGIVPSHWRGLIKWMEDPVLSQPEWEDPAFRNANLDIAVARIGEFVARFAADDFVKEAQHRGLPAAHVNTPAEFLDSLQAQARSWVQELDHPVIGAYRAPGPAFRMSRTPLHTRRPAPLLGQHQAEVLAGLEHWEPRASQHPKEGNAQAPMLQGLRIADLTRFYAGPIGTMFLGFYGAQVVKVESAELEANRDLTRPMFADYNRSKLGCTIDARHPQGKELLRRLVASSDVLVDNFSPGVINRLGVSYEDVQQVKPDIIQVTMPGMGLAGPLRHWVTWGSQVMTYSGLGYLWGYPDGPMEARSKIVFADYVGAAMLGLVVLAALEHRDQTGEGQFIELSLLEGQASLLGPAYLDYTVNGRRWDAEGYREHLGGRYAPYGCYPCRGSDAWIIIACQTDEEWQGLARLMGEPLWASEGRFTSRSGRREHWEELDQRLAEWTVGYTPRRLLRLLQGAGVPAGIPMSGEDLYHDLHLRARGHIVENDHPWWGHLAYSGLPGIPSLSAADASGLTPWIGQDNAYVFGQLLEMEEPQIKELEEAGAIH